MRGLGLILTIALLAPTPGAAAVTSREVAAILAPYNKPSEPGCAAGVVEKGSLTAWAAYGLADVENRIPIRPDTRFDIGSMSKQFLAMAVLTLAAEGKLSLSDDIHKYVPELPNYPWRVTLTDLLHHTSGLKDYDQLLQVAGWRDGDLKSASDVLWAIERQPELAFRPGARYSYSDSNYFLLGLVAQRVSRQPVPDLLTARIFQPLGMVHTLLRTDRWALVDAKAWPYLVRDGAVRLFVNAEEPLGDGGIFSTIGDLALWESNFNDAKVGGRAVIAQMQALRPLLDGRPNEYAAGLYVRDFRGVRLIEHSGASYGYLAEKLWFPDRKVSVIVLCNRRDGPYVALSDQLAELTLGLHPPPSASPVAPTPRAQLERFGGLYFSDMAADGVSIEARDGAVFDTGSDRTYLQKGPLSFTAPPEGTLCRCATTYMFRIDAAGRITGFDATRPAGPGGEVRVRYEKMSPDSAPRVADYAGEYVSDDTATAWCLNANKQDLTVRRRGFPDRPLQLLWKDAAAGPGGILQFERDTDSVTGFHLRNPRLNAVAFRKLPTGKHPVPAPWRCN